MEDFMKYVRFIALLLIAATLAFFACGGNSGSGGGSTRVTFDSADTPGDVVSITIGSETIKMIYANDQASITFPFSPSIGTLVDNQKETITHTFFMGETQVPWAVWKAVYDWATDDARGAHRYAFGNPGRMGSAADGAGMTVQHPVTAVSWRDAVIWCNALTEMTGAAPVYVANGANGTTDGAVLRSSLNGVYGGQNVESVVKSEDDNCTRKGYRLPTNKEWEYAARYVGTDAGGRTDYVSRNTNGGHADLTEGYYWTPAAYASGATTYYNDNSDGSGEPARSANDAVAVYKYYWDGSLVDNGTSSTAVVKSKGIEGANALGLYDMSGNVWEWCFTESGSNRVDRGGGWSNWALHLSVGYWTSGSPDSLQNSLGFRLARTQEAY